LRPSNGARWIVLSEMIWAGPVRAELISGSVVALTSSY
jgi:hypothetical protein